MIERFEFTCPDCDPYAVLVNHGPWVRFSDYEALRAENERLAAELADLASQVEELEQNREAAAADFEGDCWKAMRRLLDACEFDWPRIDPADGVTAADAEEWIRETIENIEGEAKSAQVEAGSWRDTAKANLELFYAERNRALAAEAREAKAVEDMRERAAQIAREEGQKWKHPGGVPAAASAADIISTAIRALPVEDK